MSPRRWLLGIVALVLAGSGVALVVTRPWEDKLPADATTVAKLPSNPESRPIDQWTRGYIAVTSMVQGKPGERGASTYVDPNAIALKAPDATHAVEIARMHDGLLVTKGQQPEYCALRKDVDRPEGWVEVWAAWRLPRGKTECKA